jgi:hypothetical protein
MLFGETVAVYCENHTEHTDTVRTSQETHYVSATEPNRLMPSIGLCFPSFKMKLQPNAAASNFNK